MKGEKDFQKAIEENLNQIEAEPDSLYGVNPFKRALIGFAGPFFNFIFSVIAFSIIAGIGYTYYTYSNKITIATEIYPELHSAAAEAGIKSGDKIISVAGKKTENFNDLLVEISSRPDEDILIEVDRDGENLSFTVHSDLDKKTGSGKIGVVADSKNVIEVQTPEYGFFGAIGAGIKEAFNAVSLTLKSLTVLFKGVEVKNAVSGPARVTDMLGSTIKEGFAESAKIGIISTLSLLAIISVSLFIMNLLPIPVLDGGLILIALIELILHKKIKPKIQYFIQMVGIAFIVLIFLVGLSGDITYFTAKK
ncbi:putative membrane-associated Zn-dependent protease 1 [Treponema sp. JC4]|nr:putative membrane-associated Zn-dependent protease 1 [Treponema sp. JC4]